MASARRVKRYRWDDLGVRVLSALVLIPAAILAVAEGSWLFLLAVSVGAAFLSLEWGVMSAPRAATRVGGAVLFAVLAAVFAAYVGDFSASLILLVFGATAAGIYARMIGVSPVDAAYGALYVGWPCVVLVWLRGGLDGAQWTILLFAVAWSADIAAYLIGSVLKGPKLWPRFSPNKTWSGFIGGLAAGVGGAVAAASLQGMNIAPATAALVGLVAALATMAGDLWESALKRRFGVKDAGDLIPGHGGLMDRVDGLMFAVVAVAASRLLVEWTGP